LTGFLDRFRIETLEVTGITRGDEEIPILALGGPEFYAIYEHVIAAIQFGKHRFWVDSQGKRVSLVFKLHPEQKRFYLTTRDEGFPPRTLLSLPECDEDARRRPSLRIKSPRPL
jgi:hypothetical protein